MKICSHCVSRVLPAVFCFIVLTLAACTVIKSTDESQNDTLTLAYDSVPDTLAAQQPLTFREPVPEPVTSYEDSLLRYFTPEQVPVVKQARAEFNQLKTSAEMAHYYFTTLPVILDILYKQIQVSDPNVYSGDDAPSKHWQWFESYYPTVYFSVNCSECSYEPYAAISRIAEKADSTMGKDDEAFFALAFLGEQDSYKLVDCDFCAASTLGEGRNSEMLKLIEQTGTAQTLFSNKIREYRAEALSVNSDFYYYDKKKVLAEVDLMLKSKILTAEERATLKEFRDSVAADKAGQFGCGTTTGCDWGNTEGAPEYNGESQQQEDQGDGGR